MIKSEGAKFIFDWLLVEEAAVVVKHREVVAGACVKRLHKSHNHNSSPFAGGFEFTPADTIILAHRETRGIKTRPDDQALFAVWSDYSVNCGNFLRGGPAFWSWKAITPAEAAVDAALINDLPFPVSLWVNAKDSLAVLQQGCRRVAQILILFTIHDDLMGRSFVEIEDYGFRREHERGSKEG